MRQQDRQCDVGQHGPRGAAEHEFTQARMAEAAHDEKVRPHFEGLALQYFSDRLVAGAQP